MLKSSVAELYVTRGSTIRGLFKRGIAIATIAKSYETSKLDIRKVLAVDDLLTLDTYPKTFQVLVNSVRRVMKDASIDTKESYRADMKIIDFYETHGDEIIQLLKEEDYKPNYRTLANKYKVSVTAVEFTFLLLGGFSTVSSRGRLLRLEAIVVDRELAQREEDKKRAGDTLVRAKSAYQRDQGYGGKGIELLFA